MALAELSSGSLHVPMPATLWMITQLVLLFLDDANTSKERVCIAVSACCVA